MARTITTTVTLVDVNVKSIEIYKDDQYVRVIYERLDDGGKVYDKGEAFFFVTLPPDPRPDNWFQLPAKHLSLITELFKDAKAGLMVFVS